VLAYGDLKKLELAVASPMARSAVARRADGRHWPRPDVASMALTQRIARERGLTVSSPSMI